MIPLPQKKYNIIYADPAWRFKYYGKSDKRYRRAEYHYEVSTLSQMKQIPVKEVADKNCVLFMWAIYPMLPQALELIKAWGFTFKTVAFTWVKMNKKAKSYFMGLGYWTRANPEICLLAVRGKPKRVSASVKNLVVSRIREHSRKPDEIRDMIVELCGDKPRLEMFARTAPKGWDVWGTETTKFKGNPKQKAVQGVKGNPEPNINQTSAGHKSIYKDWNWHGYDPDEMLKVKVASETPESIGTITGIMYISDKDKKGEFERYHHDFEKNQPYLGKSNDGYWILGKIRGDDITPGIRDATTPQGTVKATPVPQNMPPCLAYLEFIEYKDNNGQDKVVHFGSYDDSAIQSKKLRYRKAYVIITNSKGNKLWIGEVLQKKKMGDKDV